MLNVRRTNEFKINFNGEFCLRLDAFGYSKISRIDFKEGFTRKCRHVTCSANVETGRKSP
jgi:hypothetical protein